MKKMDLGFVLLASAIINCTCIVPILANEISSEQTDNHTMDVNNENELLNEDISSEFSTDKTNEQSVQDGWHEDGTYWSNGMQYKDGMYSIDLNTYYFDGNGNVLKNNWKEIGGNTYFFDNNGCMVKNCIYTINCHMYIFNVDGSLKRNVVHYDDKNRPDIYFGEDGKAIESQWIEIDGMQYYCKSDGYIARNAYHIQIGEDYYCFDADGQVLKDYVYCISSYTFVFGPDGKAVRNDWALLYGETCYCDDTGMVVKNDIKEIDNDIYYFDSDGRIVKNCEYENYLGNYYFGKDGKAYKNKWLETNEGLKYFGNYGYMYNDAKIYYIDGYGYAFNSNGIMLTGWQQPYLNAFNRNEDWYYFDSNGHLLTSQWIDDYYVDESGIRITNQQYKVNNDLYCFDYNGNLMKDYVDCWGDNVYYFGKDGKAIKNQWRITSDGKQYYGDNYLLYNKSGMFIIDGNHYTFDENGIMLTGWQQPYIRDRYSPRDLWYLFDSCGARVTKGQWCDGYYANEYGSRVLNQLYEIEGNFYLFDAEGKPKTNYLNGSQYFGSDGKRYTNKWLDTPNGKMYFGADGNAYRWTQKIGDDEYCFDSDGYMQTGWQQDHYYNDNGVMAKNQWVGDSYVDENGNKFKLGLKSIDDNLYYFDSEGLLKKDFEYKRYYFGLDGKAFKSQWRETENGWMYYDDNSNYYINGLTTIGDYTYSFDDNGIRCTGWKAFNTSNQTLEWSYFDSEGRLLKSQWIEDCYVDNWGVRVDNDIYFLDGGTYLFDENGHVKKNYLYQNQKYFGEDGKAYRNKWLLTNNGYMYFLSDEYCCNTPGDLVDIDGNKYTFDKNGYMLTEWQKLDNEYYYFDQSGKMIKNAWQGNYYLQDNGQMARSCWIGSYYVDSNGLWTPAKWIKTNGKWWYRHQDGSYTSNDFELIGGQIYYFDENGYMVTGWKKIGNFWYFFENSGIMAKNKWVGDYYLTFSGAMARNEWIDKYYVGDDGKYRPAQWIHTNGKWWYRHQDGSYTRDDFECITGQWYYFDGNGYMINGWRQVGSKWYYFNESGQMLRNQWLGDYYFESSGAMATNQWVGNYFVGADGVWIK